MLGSLNPAWKGGVTTPTHASRNTAAQRNWTAAVKLRDDHTCQHCGYRPIHLFSPKKIEAHHIKSFANHPLLRTDLSNGITLCETCHDIADRTND